MRDFLPQNGISSPHKGIPGKLSERDALLDQIYRDLARSRKNAFAFYREEIKPSSSCPLAPSPQDSREIEPRIASRYSLLERLEVINADFAHSMREERGGGEAFAKCQAPRTPQRAREDGFLKAAETEATKSSEADSPAITLQPASPQSLAATTPDISSVGSDGESYFASADEGDQEADEAKAQERRTYLDRRWHSLLRILYIYALLNPSTGYVQGMNEVLFVLLYVMGTTGHLPAVHKSQEGAGAASSPGGSDTAEDPYKGSSDMASSFHYLDSALDSSGSHAEADAFWCFSNLVGDIRDLYDFDGMDNAGIKVMNRRQAEAGSRPITGMAEALKKFSLRLKWLDEPLWTRLRAHSLDPRLPYYSFRWLACMVSTELTLPSVVRIWDAILAESGGGASTSDGTGSTPKIEFLIDVCCALLTNIRGALLQALEGSADDNADGDDSFGRAMQVLQGYPDDDVGPVVEMACLFRQRRLAAPLTGDGPPGEDEDESLLSVRERATKALRTWTQNTSTPSRTPKWLTASPRTPSTTTQVEGLTPTRSASATLFQRYTDAIQSSDTAANWSKASTNLTAKAMATWSGSRGAKEGQQSSLAELRTSLVNRVMSGSPSVPSKDQKQIHPSLRWSVQSMPPDLPLPNVNDSPPGREDSLSQSPLRGYISVNRLAGPNSSNAFHSPDFSSHTSSTPVTSPTSISFSRSTAGKRGVGPKPLLLTGSARPPREASANGSLSVDEPMSRKVSSGPLATNSSPHIRRKNNGSSSRRDSSYAGSGTSSLADRDSPSFDGMEESSASTKSESVHNLPSLQAVGRDWLPPVPSSISPVGLQGSGHGTGLGTVPASAFAKVRMASNGQGQEDRPAFGQVASSGNVPLATKTTLQRKANRKDSAKDSELGGLASPIGEVGDIFPNRDSIGSSISSRRYRQSSTTQSSERIEQGSFIDREAEQHKYTLTDEPTTSTRASAPTRAGSSSSTKSTGISRRQRAFSSGKRTRRSMTQAAKQEEAEGSNDLVARGGRESIRLGTVGRDMHTVGRDAVAPEILPPKSLEADPGRLMPAEELLSRLQLDHGYSGGESSGFEDETHSSTRLHPGQSYLARTASSEEDKRGLGISNLRNDEGEFEGYTTADMAAIGSALAFAYGGEEEGEESGT